MVDAKDIDWVGCKEWSKAEKIDDSFHKKEEESKEVKAKDNKDSCALSIAIKLRLIKVRIFSFVIFTSFRQPSPKSYEYIRMLMFFISFLMKL